MNCSLWEERLNYLLEALEEMLAELSEHISADSGDVEILGQVNFFGSADTFDGQVVRLAS